MNIKLLYDSNNKFYAQVKYSEDIFSNYSKHSHETLNITALKEGCIQVDVYLKETQYLKPKQLCFFNPQEVHLTKSMEKSSKGYYSLHLNKQWCIKIQKKIFKKMKLSYLPLSLNILSSEYYYDAFVFMCDRVLREKESSSIHNEVSSFLRKIFTHYCKEIKNEIKLNENNIPLETIESYIMENINEQLSLEDIAYEVGYNTSYIIRAFKKKYGLSPHAYMINKKINCAENILAKNSNLNVSDIAYEFGFCDQSHFTRSFKRVFGISPNTYK